MAVNPGSEAGFAMTAVAEAFVQQGHRVVFVGGAGDRSAIERVGARFVEIPPLPEGPLPSRVLPGLQQIDAIARSVFDGIDDQWALVRRLIDEHDVDVVLTDPLFIGASALCLLPAAQRPPVIALGVFPLLVPDREVPPFGTGLLPLDGPVNGLRNALLSGFVDGVLLRRTAHVAATTLERVTGVKTSGRLQQLIEQVDVWAQLTVPRFEYPRAVLPANVRFVGPLRAAQFGEVPEWWLDRDPRPVVHVAHLPGDDPRDVVVPAVRGLAGEDLLVVVTTSGDCAAVLEAIGEPLPENVRVVPAIPFGHLLPVASAMVTRGNYVVVQYALQFGVPLVVAGAAREQVESNARIRWAGVGADLRTTRPSPEQLRDAVRTVLADEEVYAASARIAAQIARTDAQEELVRLAEELVAGWPDRVRAEERRSA